MSQPVKITDTTFRDAHQSLLATRLRLEDMLPIAEEMDAVGFHSMEVWGGATFDVCTRFLNEDPWERLRTFKSLMPNTKLQMLLRGQSLVGYRAYPDDVVNSFVERSSENGIDIFRVFDALNDEWNLTSAAKAVLKNKKHLQMTLCYSITESGKLGGSIYNLEYYINKARTFKELGAHSIAVKDMAGLLSPYDAYDLISALKSEFDLPIQLHTHYTSGMASMTLLKAIEAGVDTVDTCLSPLALRTSQPAIEPLLSTLQSQKRDPQFNLENILLISGKLEQRLSKYIAMLDSSKSSVIDATVLSHQIPGGMFSNLLSQLRETGSEDRLQEVMAEIPVTRKELGYPPLVTPMSQMIGSQAVSNVLFDRNKMVTNPIHDYVLVKNGRPPAAIDESIKSFVLKDLDEKVTEIKSRPADQLKPELGNAKEELSDITSNADDILTYVLYPTTGLGFLRRKYGLETLPEDSPSPTTEDQRSATEQIVNATTATRTENLRAFNVYLNDEVFYVEVDPLNLKNARVETTKQPPDKLSELNINDDGLVIKAPINGIVIKYLVSEGDQVSTGQDIVVLEAMKMENTLPSPASGIVKKLTQEVGVKVDKGTVLAIIEANH
ncbi:MAG: pyruvate carboxylase subunit B [SAR202 cluster bacterium]|nr:pyruvate carboxylase subunit B [SAR202 cluster bacterium]